MRNSLVAVLVVVLLVAGAGYWFLTGSNGNAMVYRLEPVNRGELLASIGASGTLEPEDVVDVGAQVAGLIKEFGTDQKTGKPVDYGSAVEAGAILAHIDDSLFKARVEQSRAQVQSAKAKLESAKARLESAKAKVESSKANSKLAEATLQQSKARDYQTARDWERAKRLGPTTVISAADYDSAKMMYETNRSAIAVSDASVAQAKANELDAQAAVGDAQAAIGDAEANIATAKAALNQDEINLGYCTIKATVKGVIIDRRVTIGQTVQSSFNTPSLFLLAKDLTRMKVWASVNEADISQVRVGQSVKFTVDTYAGQTFLGTVALIRLNATNTQNVVTYTVEVITDNQSGKLLPYMTATLQFEVARHANALLVPNAALRFKPTAQQVVPEARALLSGKPGKGKEKDKDGPPNTGTGSAADRERQVQGTVWVDDNGLLRPIVVKLGLTDGNLTEILDDNFAEGTVVVTGETRSATAASDEGSNPFATKWGGKKK